MTQLNEIAKSKCTYVLVHVLTIKYCGMSHYSWFHSYPVNAYPRRDLRKARGGKGTRKTREWSSAKMARESKVLILLRGGYDPCYFSQRHNPPLSFGTWPDHTLLENVQILVTAAPRVPAFRRLSSYIAYYYFPIFFGYEAFSIPDNFITT